MNLNKIISIINNNNLGKPNYLKKGYLKLFFILAIVLVPIRKLNSEEIFLKCTGKFEINRGELIKPDWETSYLKINLDGLISTINDKGIKKVGNTSIKGNSYVITHRGIRNEIKSKYKIDRTYGTYKVEYPKRHITLIGTCEKGRG
tara:strand:+ start:278 stop:715 length:438 start_codon:yes stop_codon:yes gene_type:complete